MEPFALTVIIPSPLLTPNHCQLLEKTKQATTAHSPTRIYYISLKSITLGIIFSHFPILRQIMTFYFYNISMSFICHKLGHVFKYLLVIFNFSSEFLFIPLAHFYTWLCSSTYCFKLSSLCFSYLK